MLKNYYSIETRQLSSSTVSTKQEVISGITKKRTWVSFLTMFVALFSFVFSQAQSVSNYAFSSANNATLENLTTGATSLLTGNHDDTATTIQAIGFDFYFMGAKYTLFSANSNGQIRLHASASETAISGGGVTSYTANTATLAPMAGDNEVNDGIKMKLVGTAPNRKLVVEWTQFYAQYNNITNAGNMQLSLNETSNVIEFIYGEIYNSTTSSLTRSIFISSGNTATASGHVLVGALPTFTAATTPVTNTFAASTVTSGVASPLIANLGSSASGGRLIYTFTPSTIVLGDVDTLTFTTVTPNNTTLNWIDNATNEVAFFVTRATNASFTQNVTTTIVPSTTSVGTGTAYTSIQSGLSAGTTYYYKVLAVIEGGQSTGISGNQTTLNGATYYWTGITGSTWDLFANWNTSADGTGSVPTAWATSDIYVIDGTGTTPGGALSISVDRASFTVGQIKITSNTNLTLASSATTTRTITVSGGPNEDFVLENGSTLNLNSATNAVAFAFTGAGNTGTIAGTYIASGSTSNNINTTGGSGTLVTVTNTGIVNNTILGSSGCLLGSVATLNFTNGSNYTHSSFTTSNGFIPLATWGASSNVFITGGTSSTGLTNATQTFGNFTYNSATSTATFSAFTTGTTAVINGNLTISNTNTGTFRALTSGTLTVNGNVIITQGRLQSASSTGTLIANGTTTIDTNGILDILAGNYSQRGNTFTNNGTLTGPAGTLQFINFTGSATQTLAGTTGTVLTNIANLSMQNTAGLIITHLNPIVLTRVNLFQGTITNSNKITFGTGLAVNCVTQIGSTGLTTPGGNFDTLPLFNLGTGTYSINYAQESVSRISGFEIPTTRSINNLVFNNTNGITISGGDITTISSLALTNGIVSTGTNTLTLGNSTTVGTLTGGSATAYVNGSLSRSIASANTNATYVTFPIGKSGAYTPIDLAPATTSIAIFKAESFGSNTGTSDPSVIGLSTTRRFQAIPVSGTFTDINVRLADATITSTNIPVQAPTAAGAYSAAFGSVATFTAGTPNTIQSNFPATSANYTGFLSFANSNACSGTPTPGNTVASSTSICFGESVTLSLQNTTSGSGVTYQWKSSTDGTTYSTISGATNSTLTVIPTVVTYYICDVTCSAGPAMGTSVAVQVNFSNSITATTPGTRCGTGTVDLAATPNTGASVNWYTAQTGGSLLGSGNNFTTPSISATTTYYVSANTATPGNLTLGNGTALTGSTSQNSIFCNYWYQGWKQMVFTATELQASGLNGGNINSITFNIASLPSPATVNNFSVSIGTTSNSALSTFTTTGLSSHFGPVNYTPTLGLNTITLTTPYNWDGVSNIIIDIRELGQYGSSNSTTYVTTTTTNTVVHGYSSTNNSSYYTSSPAATPSNTRPNIIFNGQVACSSIRVPVVATVTTAPALTLSASTTAICESDSSSAVTLASTVGDYNTYVWSPSTGVTGNEVTGWSFNPSTSTTYTLTATQTSGSLCSKTTSFAVTVNPRPSIMTVADAAVCVDAILPLTATGGTLSNITILNENFNGVTNNWVTTNASTLGTPASAAWTLQPNGYLGFNSNDASQFYNTNSDAQGSGGITDTALDSPSFSTVGFSDATINFYHYYRHLSSTAKVQYTTDGSTWVDLETYTTTDGTTTGFVQKSIALPAAALNQASVKIRFKYDGAYSWYWAIDNVLVSGTQATTISWSPVTNLYTDAAATVAYIANANATTVYFKSSTAAAATTYTITSTTSQGCSRTTTANVTVNALTSNSTTITACDSYTWAANGTTYTTGGTYTNVTGCNTETLNLTITTSSSLPNEVVTACDTYTWAANGTTYTTGGTYTSTTNCVTRTLNLTITTSSSLPNEVVSVCDTYTWAANGTTYTTGGTYTSTTNCVTRTLNLTITTSSSLPNEVVSACATYTWAANGTTYTTGGTYTSTTNCVTRTLNLTINALPNNATSQSGDTLSATENGATYQWVLCDGSFTPISGATSQSYMVTAVGSYAVEVTKNGCMLRSACINVTTLGGTTFNLSKLKYYPNPVLDIFTVSNSENITSIDVYDLSGRRVKKNTSNNTEVTIDMSDLAASVYVVKVFSEGKSTEFKIVKK